MNWLKIDKVTIFNGKDENGNRYLSQFLSDYKKVFNTDIINAGCQRCLEDYYLKLTKHLQMKKNVEKKEAQEYILKAKYNGIPLKFGSPIYVTNSNINKKYAEELLKNHKRGVELFEKLPEDIGKSTLINLKRKELDAIATDLGLVPTEYKNKEEIVLAIEIKKEELENSDTE